MDEHVDYRDTATDDDQVVHEPGQRDWLTEWMQQGGIAVDGRDAFLEYALRMTYGALEGADRE